MKEEIALFVGLDVANLTAIGAFAGCARVLRDCTGRRAWRA